jgi:hypothetical protein
MQNHLNVKTLSFYGIMIGSVVMLFKVVSAYGESNLKAPPNISGTYSITSENLPECLKSKDLDLTIEQSGIYLFGNLTPSTDDKKINKNEHLKINLEGKMKEGKISLSGKTKNSNICPQLVKNHESDILTMNISPKNKDIVVGDIVWNSIPEATNFTAELQNTEDKESEKH